jgi:hypothetical protein
MVTLTATPSAGSTFTGWAGPCHGASPTCTLTIGSATTATAEFEVTQYTLTISSPLVYVQPFGTIGGESSLDWGSVTGTLSDKTNVINCYPNPYGDGTCSATLPINSKITLSAMGTTSEDTFVGWTGGPCSGQGDCTVTLTGNTVVDALFNPFSSLATLTVGISDRNADDAVDLVNNNSLFATCQANAAPCKFLMQPGLQFTLEAAPGSHSVFNEWTGACSSVTSTCNITMTANESVTASFD